jgi:wyosine [tRNA(Phe)-imidazoG37] synthetase (radical SAM superfamily)
MLLALQKDIVYGPVRSRRLGFSLGINILPAGTKVCTFNCLYCQYGWTDFKMLENPSAHGLPTKEQVITALENALRRLPALPAFITFSGNGEPTIHPDFASIVDGVVSVRDARAPSARTAILSNSGTVARSEVRKALGLLDVRIMKLDAGTAERLLGYNQPAPGIDLGSVMEGLRALPDVTIQALFTGGPRGNASESDVKAWVDKVKSLSPRAVQIYSLARGYPSREIEAIGRGELDAIKRRLDKAGIASEVF